MQLNVPVSRISWTLMKHRQEHQHSLPHPVCATQVDGAGSNVQGDS